jgi:hypothetical protein
MPISEQKLQELAPFIAHEKYGPVLRDAIKTWEHENVYPRQGDFGIFSKLIERNPNPRESDKFIYKLSLKPVGVGNEGTQYCCLLGGAINEKIGNGIDDVMERIYKLSTIEIRSLICGFDDEVKSEHYEYNDEAYLFAKKVGEILCG